MWPTKGKGGKGGKPEEGPKSAKAKARATRTKLKAMSAEAAAKALQEAGELDAEPVIYSEEQLEAEIFKAAELASLEQQAREEQERINAPEFLKIPVKSASMDEQLSDVWKAKLAGNKPGLGNSGNVNVPSAANRVAMEAAEKQRMNAQHEAMIGVVDRMFDHFQNLAYEFNQVAAASDLELTWIRPSIARENVGTWHQGAQYISVFSGRISTRYWTLVVRGWFEGVTVHIIPADKLLTFNSSPASFMAILDMMPVFDGSMMYWSVGQKVLKSSDMDLAFRQCLDRLVQVAQEDTPPTQPIDMVTGDTSSPESLARQTAEFIQPQQSSMLGGDIDYSERYKQHFSSDSAAQSTGQPYQGQPNYPQPLQYPGTNTSVNQNSVNYQGTSTSVNQNSVNYQGTNTSVNQNGVNRRPEASSDDWKPIVRSVRQASSSQVPNQSLSGQQAPQPPQNFQAPQAVPPFSKPQMPQVQPGQPGQTGSDGWRNVPSSANLAGNQNTNQNTNQSGVMGTSQPNAFSQPFKPANLQPSPVTPQAPPQASQFYQQPSQPMQQAPQLQAPQQQTQQSSPAMPPQFQAPQSQANATSDDWNFVPIDKSNLGQPPNPENLPPVSFPSGLFADMPANLGFPSGASAKLSQSGGTQIPPLPQIVPFSKSAQAQAPTQAPAPEVPQASQAPTARSGSNSGIANPFATPFTASSSSQQSSDQALQSAGQNWGPVQIGPKQVPPTQQSPTAATPPAPTQMPQPNRAVPPPAPADLPVRPQHLPPQRPQSFPALEKPGAASTLQNAGAPVKPEVDKAQRGFTAGSGSPWSSAPVDSNQVGNRGEVQGAGSDRQNMIAPPRAPLPPGATSAQSVSSGSVSVDKIAFSIANESMPPVASFDASSPPVVLDFDVADVLSDALADEADDWEAGLAIEPVENLPFQINAQPPALEIAEPPHVVEDPVARKDEYDEPEEPEPDSAPEPEPELEPEPGLELDGDRKEQEDQEDQEEQEAKEKDEFAQLPEARDHKSEDDHDDSLGAVQEQTEAESELRLDEENTRSEQLENQLVQSQPDNSSSAQSSNIEPVNHIESSALVAAPESQPELTEDYDLDLDQGLNQDLEDELRITEQIQEDLAQLVEMQEEVIDSIELLKEEIAGSGKHSNTPADQATAEHWRGPDSELEQSPTSEAGLSVTSPAAAMPLPAMPGLLPISASLGSNAPDIVTSSQHSIKIEIERVIGAFDKELELISSKGSDAFARRDLRGAEHMIKLAETISEYKDALAKLKDDYDKDLS